MLENPYWTEEREKNPLDVTGCLFSLRRPRGAALENAAQRKREHARGNGVYNKRNRDERRKVLRALARAPFVDKRDDERRTDCRDNRVRNREHVEVGRRDADLADGQERRARHGTYFRGHGRNDAALPGYG